ncbi:MAG TPA: ester cyclase [Anaerolineales bacterium]|nr:ester cyclase [Anaerolineales bacterium]
MTTEQNKAIVRRFFEAFKADDQAALKEVLAPDVVAHLPGAPGPQNREAMLQGVSMFNAAFSDRSFTIDDLIAEGDRVATRTTMRAVHSGDYQGQPPTGKQIVVSGLTIERIQDGKIVERWFIHDRMDLMQQLGLVPPPQASR